MMDQATLTVIELAEHHPSRLVELSYGAGRALAASGLVEATPDPYLPGRWRVKAANKVGVAKLTVPGGQPIMLRIAAKIPISRLLFLLGYSLNPKGWRDDEVLLGTEPELLPAMAHLFAQQAENALRQGLMQGYRSTEETSLVLRGRIREADQIRRQHAKMIPLEIIYDEYTPDIPENQLLRTACDRLLQLDARVSAQVRGRLLRLRVRLGEITPIARGHRRPTWQPSRLNTRYQPALRLAELVLQGSCVEHHPGDITVTGFLFDLSRVFEDFITVALREALTGCAGRCVLQASHHLDERNQIRIRPDFVRYAEDGSPVAVVDAKYKAEKPKGYPDADLYQMLAYCTALDLPQGHLIYAKGNSPPAQHRVRHAGITLHQHSVDLDQTPAELLKDLRTLAETI